MEERKSTNENPRILTDEDRRNFDGVTINEMGEEETVYNDQKSNLNKGDNPFGGGLHIKTFNLSGWKWKAWAIAILLGLIAFFYFFGIYILKFIFFCIVIYYILRLLQQIF